MDKPRLLAVVLIVIAGISMIYLIVMMPAYLEAIYASVQRLIQSPQVSKVIQDAVRPHLPVTSPEELLLKLNQYRISIKREPFKDDVAVCGPLSNMSSGSEDIFSVCRMCSHASLISVGKYASSNQILERLLADESTAETVQSANLTHACAVDKGETLSLYIVKMGSEPIKSNVPKNKPVQTPSTAPTYFTETQLWQALQEYRHAHGKPELQTDEKVCVYARKRVQEHIDKMKSVPQSEYPNQDKYPLDAHAGFTADASSGYAFEITGKTQLAENLAYWPTAKSAAHVIEWGWDTSTEGHREAQLSDVWTHACISGNQGFYVAIYGK